MKGDRAGAAMLAVAAANVIWGFGAMFSRIGLGIASPAVLMAWRFFTAFVLIRVIAAVRRIRLRIDGRPVRRLLLMALFEPVLYFALEQYGILLTSATFAGIILSMGPIGTLIFGAAFLHEKPSARQIVFCFVSIAGVLLLSGSPGSGRLFSLAGTLLLVGALFSGSAYITTNRSLSETYTPFERTYSMTAIGVVFFFLWAFLENIPHPSAVFLPLKDARFAVSAAYLGAMSTVTAYLLVSFAADRLSVARIAVFNNVYTIVAALSGILFLHEPFFPMLIPCTAIILLGVWGVQRFAPEAGRT